MSNLVKVYDKTGKVVDSFLKPVTIRSRPNPTYEQMVKLLNSKGYYIRKQFSKSGKTLVRSFV